ncbi:MAG: sulfatase-like hydrolase/transferase [Thermomicrobiales bacterium]
MTESVPTRPNVLFLMSDEHRADVAGFMGNDIVRTPVLDRLAESGVVFTSAYTPSPICVPGRQSIMAGQFPRTSGCRDFSKDLPPGHMTFSKRFTQFGYQTVACGKLHHTGTDQMQGWSRRMGGDMYIAPHFVEDRDEASFEDLVRPLSKVKWSDAKEIARAGVGTSHYSREDDYAVQGAIDFIDEYFTSPQYDREQPDRPVMLKVSLNQPHYPYQTTEERFAWYINRIRPFEGQEAFDHPFLSQRTVTPGVDVNEREIRRAVAAYYGMIETMDELMGRVLDRLEYVGQNLDDWIIIYTSDHGEMLGEHGIWEKQKFFEGSARVPLFIRYPGHFDGGRRISQNVSLCDLFSTMCDLSGIPVPEGLDSRSLVSLLNNGDSGWDNEAVSQFGQHNLMIKRDQLKYQWYGPDMPEVLFDLERDPDERTNAITNPLHTAMLDQFRIRRDELGYGETA